MDSPIKKQNKTKLLSRGVPRTLPPGFLNLVQPLLCQAIAGWHPCKFASFGHAPPSPPETLGPATGEAYPRKNRGDSGWGVPPRAAAGYWAGPRCARGVQAVGNGTRPERSQEALLGATLALGSLRPFSQYRFVSAVRGAAVPRPPLPSPGLSP